MPTDKLKIKFGIMNHTTQTVVNVPIHEWNELQERLKILERAIDSKKPFSFQDAWQNGTIKIISLDDAFLSFLRNIQSQVDKSSDQLRKQWELESTIRKQNDEIAELKKQIPVKK